jgi:hypothetical protein
MRRNVTWLGWKRTMTPNERLSPEERNALLSSSLKFSFPGNRRMMRSTHIIEAGGV